MPTSVVNGLCSLADVKASLGGITNTDNDLRISRAINTASRLVENKCGRRFWQDQPPRVDTATVTEGSSTVLDATILATDVGRSLPDVAFPPLSVVQQVIPGVSFQIGSAVNQDLFTALAGAGSATIGLCPRRFAAIDQWLCLLEDADATPKMWEISSLEGLVVQTDYAGDGTFSTLWTPLDFQLEPINALQQGEPQPFTQIRAIRSLYFPVWGGLAFPRPGTQALVMVTAQWGWPAIPAVVNEAAILQSCAIYKAEDAPFGLTTFGETGVLRVRSELHPTAQLLLDDWLEDEVWCI